MACQKIVHIFLQEYKTIVCKEIVCNDIIMNNITAIATYYSYDNLIISL
jgi:hypothetical protein